jgi:hypothetical protein
MEVVVVEVGAEAATGAAGGAMKGTGAALLPAPAGPRLEPQELEDSRDRQRLTQGGEIDGRPRVGSIVCGRLVVLLTQELATFAGLGEFEVASVEDLLFLAIEFVLGSDVTDSAVQADQIVMGHVIEDDASSVLQGQRRQDADALALEGFVPAFFFAIGLGIVGRCPHVGHAGDADELFEIFGDKLRPVVGDDAGPGVGKDFTGALQDGFHVGFLHFFADFPVDDVTAITVEDAAEGIKRAGDIQETDIDMPVLVGLERLLEARAFFGGRGRDAGQQVGLFEDAIDAGGATGHDVLVEHHEGHAAIAFERMLASEVANAFLLVGDKPVIAWDPGVVLVDLAETLDPIVVLAGADADPGQKVRRGDVALVGPGADEIDDLVAGVVGDPAAL